MMNAALLTWLASLTQKPPMLGMSVDQIRTMKEGFMFDGTKAERELGIAYTPIRTALEEAIASYQESAA
jgi:dihydroflavonol-4-reductase